MLQCNTECFVEGGGGGGGGGLQSYTIVVCSKAVCSELL